MCGGAFLSYEGAHKIVHALKGDDHEHAVPAAALGPEAEKATIAGAIRTDLILSAEIMVISLKEVIDEPLVSRAVILVVVAFLITVVRSEEHTSELQSLMRISYAVFCLKKKNQ